MRTIINSKYIIWLLLALPGAAMALPFVTGEADAMDMLHPTGEWSARLMILAMLIGPLSEVAGPAPWTRWLLVRRRWFGFSAFLYASAHLVFYVIDMGTIEDMLAEIGEAGIWTGWLAMLAIAVCGLTSNDAAMRVMRRGWKQAQRCAYPAAVLTLFHWGLLTWHWTGALAHFAPLILLTLARVVRRQRKPRKKELPA